VKPNIAFFASCCLFILCLRVSGQVVFSDDFSEFASPDYVTTGNLNGSAWSVYRSGIDWGARRHDNPFQLEISNDISGSGNLAGYCFTATPTTDFASPYNPVLINGGVVTWTFNMRQPRTDPGGFDAASYGVAFILAAETATTNTTGAGYAVVLGQGGSTDPVRLVRYTDGISGNATLTNIIASNTAGLADLGDQHLSVKVVYNPCLGGVWELFLRNDGTSFADPLSGTLTSQGTATDNTHTGLSLAMMAAYWQGSVTASQAAYFNNTTVTVSPLPSITLGANPVICAGVTSANLTYSGLTPGADQYSIDWSLQANTEGFIDVVNASLPPSPISLTVPANPLPGIYSADLTVTNSTTQCESVISSFTVTVNALPVMGCPNDTILCSNEPSYMLTGGTPSGGMYAGPGVSAGVFNPSQADVDINVITYSYTNMNNCMNTCTYDITINAAPDADAGSYGPACLDGADIPLAGLPGGGTWSGAGVSGNWFDPSFGTQTLTYTVTTMDGCIDSDQTTIVVTSCAAPSTMQWILLQDGQQYGPCASNSDCDENVICYGLEYTPLYTGSLTSYTTGFFMDCNNGSNPVVSNLSCIMTDNSTTLNFCSQVDSILFHSSGNSGALPIVMGTPVIIHQVCFSIPSSGVMIITKDNTTGLSASVDLTGGGFATDEIEFYDPYVVDSSIACGILPLRWLSFTAASSAPYVTTLDWSTADEINTSHFEIQRSAGPQAVFQTIGRVEADTEQQHVHHYNFVDVNARPGKNYYRIRQLDHDGRDQYSIIRTITYEARTVGVEAWPNPASDHLMVNIESFNSPGTLQLIDMSGRLIYHFDITSEINHHEIDLDAFREGAYILKVEGGGQRHTQKIFIIK
jgi:hypothetical protein